MFRIVFSSTESPIPSSTLFFSSKALASAITFSASPWLLMPGSRRSADEKAKRAWNATWSWSSRIVKHTSVRTSPSPSPPGARQHSSSDLNTMGLGSFFSVIRPPCSHFVSPVTGVLTTLPSLPTVSNAMRRVNLGSSFLCDVRNVNPFTDPVGLSSDLSESEQRPLTSDSSMRPSSSREASTWPSGVEYRNITLPSSVGSTSSIILISGFLPSASRTMKPGPWSTKSEPATPAVKQ
mmetsp:Transcript_6017/g.15337  ORF Transcript_6017/g.15337 Transcript_6017/m.15337 type:complete len:237 (+) Transcript_6017:3423-4133(+)